MRQPGEAQNRPRLFDRTGIDRGSAQIIILFHGKQHIIRRLFSGHVGNQLVKKSARRFISSLGVADDSGFGSIEKRRRLGRTAILVGKHDARVSQEEVVKAK